MKISLGDFYVVDEPFPCRHWNLYLKTEGDPVFINTYDENWIESRLPGAHAMWIERDILDYCEQEGLEFE